MKGQKTGGRKKGTPNKATSTLRDWFLQLVNDNRQQIETDLREMEAKDRLQWIEKILPYILPKVQNPIEVEGAVYTRDNITHSNTSFENYRLCTWADEQGKRKFEQSQRDFKEQQKREEEQRDTILSYIEANAEENAFGFEEHAPGAQPYIKECGYNCLECSERKKCKVVKVLNEVREIKDCDKQKDFCNECSFTADCKFFEIMINEMADDESDN